MRCEASGCLTVSAPLQTECDALQLASDLLNTGREVLCSLEREAPISMIQSNDGNDLFTVASDSLNLAMFASTVRVLACCCCLTTRA